MLMFSLSYFLITLNNDTIITLLVGWKIILLHFLFIFHFLRNVIGKCQKCNGGMNDSIEIMQNLISLVLRIDWLKKNCPPILFRFIRICRILGNDLFYFYTSENSCWEFLLIFAHQAFDPFIKWNNSKACMMSRRYFRTGWSMAWHRSPGKSSFCPNGFWYGYLI